MNRVALPEALRLPTPRQPTVEVRRGRAYRSFSAMFVVLLTAAVVLFLASFLLPRRFFWPLWIAAGGVILLTAPLRAWGLRKGLLSYFVHGTAVEGTVIRVEPAGERTWRLAYRFEADGREVAAEALVYDAPEPPLAPGDPVPVLHRPADPADSVLPTLAGILPPPSPPRG